jgi:hypothetical protein
LFSIINHFLCKRTFIGRELSPWEHQIKILCEVSPKIFVIYEMHFHFLEKEKKKKIISRILGKCSKINFNSPTLKTLFTSNGSVFHSLSALTHVFVTSWRFKRSLTCPQKVAQSVVNHALWIGSHKFESLFFLPLRAHVKKRSPTPPFSHFLHLISSILIYITDHTSHLFSKQILQCWHNRSSFFFFFF